MSGLPPRPVGRSVFPVRGLAASAIPSLLIQTLLADLGLAASARGLRASRLKKAEKP